MRHKEKTLETNIREETRMQDGIIYTYTLLMSESKSFSSYRIPLYSIKVEMIQSDGTVTQSESNKIFADLGIATDFFEKMVKNLATPIDLPYVIEDEFYKHTI